MEHRGRRHPQVTHPRPHWPGPALAGPLHPIRSEPIGSSAGLTQRWPLGALCRVRRPRFSSSRGPSVLRGSLALGLGLCPAVLEFWNVCEVTRLKGLLRCSTNRFLVVGLSEMWPYQRKWTRKHSGRLCWFV